MLGVPDPATPADETLDDTKRLATLKQDGSTNGYVAWNLRTKDNLDVAPGLYLYHVDAPGVGTTKGKFAILK